MKKNILRMINLFLVLTMLVSFIPAFAAESGNKWLKFNKTGDTSQAIIVEGRGIKLVNTAPSGLYLSTLIIRDKNNEIVPPNSVCEINQSNDTLNAVAGARGVYTVSGDFYTLNATGNADETYYYLDPVTGDDNYFNTIAKVSSDKNNLIKQDSFVSLEVSKVAPDGSPQFTVLTSPASEAPIGVFAEFDSASATKATEKDEQFYYDVVFKKANSTSRFTIQLVTTHKITEKSRFRISFATQKSDSIILEIKTKEELVGDIVKALKIPDQRSPYIQLTALDDLNFITSDFTVAKVAEVYGVDVNLNWTWIPDTDAGKTAISVNEQLFSDFNKVRVKRQEEDMQGTLKAVITYLPSGSPESDAVSAVCDLRLKVKGSGTPPSVLIVKNESPLETTPIQTNNTLDLYDGSVPGFEMQPGSYNPMMIELLLGKKGGRADYVTLSSSNTNIALAKKQGSTVGNYTDTYVWKAKLDNPSGDELIEEPINLKFFPQQVGTTTITAEFYVVTSTGSLKINEIKFNVVVVNSSPSSDSTLSDLDIFEIESTGESTEKNYTFNPQTKEYNFFVGNWVQSLKFKATKNDLKAYSDIEIKKDSVSVGTIKSGIRSDAFTIDDPTQTKYVFEIVVKAQNLTTTTYKINIERLPPSDDANLKNLIVRDEAENVIAYSQSDTPTNKTFNPAVKRYKMSVPYNIKKITLETPTNHIKAVVAIDPEPQSSINPFDHNKYITISENTTMVTITVTAEDGVTKSIYELLITRLAPDANAMLTSLNIKDYTTQPVDYPFDKYTDTYDTIQVDNPVKFVTIYPVPDSKYATVTVNGEDIATGKGKRIDLDVNVLVPVTVTVLAENGIDSMTYRLTLKRMPPSTDATLKNLTVGSLALSPLFSPTGITYTAIANATTTTVSVVPTATHKLATIMVNKLPVKSGTSSDAIQLSEKTVVTIVVTAEDKITKKTYTVSITNDDLRLKSTNADLKSLKVNEGDISPTFKSSITTYNVPVDKEIDYIDIIPIPADKRAVVAVKQGSKYIGDYEGNFSQTIKDGANKFTVEVTADDGKTKKSYSLNINRAVSGQQGALKPISTDQIDFKKSKTIYVDITKYAVISSKVFTELAKYPDTTIIFQGIDYSIAFKGSDLSKVVPFAETYNLAMSFTSPDEDDIRALLSSSDSGIAMVTLYFKHHGALPAKATLMVDLGTKYKSKTMYLHYYNQDMDRNEYYGTLKTNSRGAVAFKVDHFSTYMLTFKRLTNSIDKSSAVNIAVNADDKLNPDTGAFSSKK